MSREDTAHHTQERVVDEYFAALLGAGAGGPGDAWATGAGSEGSVPALEVMLFRVQGLRLAIPASQLERTADWPPVLLPPQPPHPWVRGRFGAGAALTTVMDSAQILIPPRFRRADPEPCPRIIILRGGAWALTCDAHVESMTLPAQGVQWRTVHTTRPWLAGTLRSHECGLLDVAALIGHVRAELES